MHLSTSGFCRYLRWMVLRTKKAMMMTVMVLFVIVVVVEVVRWRGMSPRDTFHSLVRHFHGRLAETKSDVSGYDVEEISRWYQGSECSGRSRQFVGDGPLFPPCRSDVAPGVALWGKYPYMGPMNYLKSSKNPCWNDTGVIRCVPYFYLIGVSKSGTSDLYYRLTLHPEVIRTTKEPHFFDRRRYIRDVQLQGYTTLFKWVASQVKRDIRTTGHSDVICGDASPSYFYDSYEWPKYSGNEGCSEPRVILGSHLRHLWPQFKIIMIIRHPVHRLYSRYLFDYGRNPLKKKAGPPSPQTFHDWVVDGVNKYRACFQRWSLRHCVYNKSLENDTRLLRIQESLYPVLMEDWLRVVPRDRFFFIRFEDYKRNMASSLRGAYRHLGLKELTDEQMDSVIKHVPKNQGRFAKIKGPMLPETEKLLHEFYSPFIRRFAHMLRDPRFLWKDLYPRNDTRDYSNNARGNSSNGGGGSSGSSSISSSSSSSTTTTTTTTTTFK